MSYADLSDQEISEIVATLKAGNPLPPRFKASLFEDSLEVELIWPGKSAEIERSVLPFQSIEQIDEPRSSTVQQFDLFSVDSGSGRQSGGWTNKLIWGDNKLIVSSLTNGHLRSDIEKVGGLKFIYIDPPFDVGADFSMDIEVGDDSVTKKPSVLEEVAFRDTWGRGKNSFLSMIYPRLLASHHLLADDGVLAIHIDWRLSSQIRLILDEIFGVERFINEIIWHYDQGARGKNRFGRKHDTIFVYSKSENFTFNSDDILVPYESGMTEWRYTKGGQAGKEMPKGKIPSDVWDMKLNAMSKEHNGYPTQKPESLLERLIYAFSNKGDLIADFFCGSGTTLAVAERLGRKWIGSDLGRFAIHTSRKRLIGVQRKCAKEGEPYRAFEILNLGAYERQYFVGIDINLPEEQRKAISAERREQFLNLILQAYGGLRNDQFAEFHGTKDSSVVFIGALDAAVTQDDVKRCIESARKSGMSRIDILGFEFEMGIKPLMVDEAREQGITITLRYIPNDVFDTKLISKNSVKFYDVGYVEVDAKQSKSGEVIVSLKDFGVFYSQDDADGATQSLRNGASTILVDSGQVVRISKDKKGIASREILTKEWSDWIDYWSVDFDYESQKEFITQVIEGVEKSIWAGRYIFENQWQDFRTRDIRDLTLKSEPHTYDTPGDYIIGVKVVDIFGNDTTKVIRIKVK